MCGRFALHATAARMQSSLCLRDMPEASQPRFNISPSQPIAVITNEEPQRLSLHRWGLVPFWARDVKIGYRMINARAESAAEKPSFRAAMRRRRCLVPASGFYEWQSRAGVKQPWYISLRERPLFAFAGLWEVWRDARGEELRSACILTTAANEFMAPLHHRMPVILAQEEGELWLGAGGQKEDVAQLQDLLRPCDAAAMQAWPVATRVNRPANDSPVNIEPLTELL